MMNTGEQERIDRFEKLRFELADPDDEALKARFQGLCHQVIESVVELVRVHTAPSIGRPVLLRIDIDSVITYVVVENVPNVEPLGKGVGYAVLRLSGRDGIDIRAAAVAIAGGPVMMAGLFEEK